MPLPTPPVLLGCPWPPGRAGPALPTLLALRLSAASEPDVPWSDLPLLPPFLLLRCLRGLLAPSSDRTLALRLTPEPLLLRPARLRAVCAPASLRHLLPSLLGLGLLPVLEPHLLAAVRRLLALLLRPNARGLWCLDIRASAFLGPSRSIPLPRSSSCLKTTVPRLNPSTSTALRRPSRPSGLLPLPMLPRLLRC